MESFIQGLLSKKENVDGRSFHFERERENAV